MVGFILVTYSHLTDVDAAFNRDLRMYQLLFESVPSLWILRIIYTLVVPGIGWKS